MKLYSIIEANYENDRWYRFEANRIYNKIMPHLEKYFKKNKEDILSREGAISLNVNKFDKKYDILVFLHFIKKVGDEKAYFSHNKGEPQIVLYPFDDSKKNKIKNVKDLFVHEFIHYLDWLRGKGYKPKGGTAKNGMNSPDYFNHAWEFNAYFQQGAASLEQWFKKYHERVPKAFENFNYFMKYITNDNGELYFFYEKYIANLDGKYKKKFQQRLYQLWVALKNKYGEKQ